MEKNVREHSLGKKERDWASPEKNRRNGEWDEWEETWIRSEVREKKVEGDTLNICSAGKSQTELGSPDHKDDFSISQGSLGGAGKIEQKAKESCVLSSSS